jgi:hypothetical protein
VSEREKGRRIFLNYTIPYTDGDVITDLYQDVFPFLVVPSTCCLAMERRARRWCDTSAMKCWLGDPPGPKPLSRD